MARETVRVEGFSDLEAKLKAMGPNIAKRAVPRALRRAAKTMADEQRARAPEGPSGNLKKSIKVSVRARNLTGLSDYAAALSSGGTYRDAQQALRAARVGGASEGTRVFVTIGSTAPHAHLVEFGTVERFWKSGKSTGTMPAIPFIRPAWDAKHGECLLAIRTELTAEIARLEGKGPKIAASEAGLFDG